QTADLLGGFLCNREFFKKRIRGCTRFDDERYLELSQGRTVFFEDVHVNHIVRFIGEKKRSSPQQDDCRLVLARTETKRNTQGFDRTMRFCRIFSYDHCHTLGHVTTLHAGYVKAKKRSQPSTMPESTTNPDKEIRG